jgi:hypothetical protein
MPLAAMTDVEIKEFMLKVDPDLLQNLLRNDVSEHIIACLSKAYGNRSLTLYGWTCQILLITSGGGRPLAAFMLRPCVTVHVPYTPLGPR